jgi:ABC-2 type transport system ATP-binding protein
VITAQNLSRRFGPLTAVDDLSFEIEKGEVVGFLGPNGAGKTTTLRILAGFLPASSGSASVAGFDVLTQSMEVRRRIGYLAESVPLYTEHRVVEMLEFQGRLHGLSRSERKARIPEVLERVGLTERSRQLVGHLSRGLRQRVGIAVALLPRPEVLILDEPTSGLDPLQRIEVRRLIQELASEHTVLISSHILPEIEAVCPRVIIINQGQLAADGTPEELVRTLGGGSHVRFEAVIGPDVAAALRLLGSIEGVSSVHDRGRLGIHHCFDIVCDEDLREDVGALAMTRSWALRELSWQKPTLEELFARIALGLDHELPREAPDEHAAEPAAMEPQVTFTSPGLELAPDPPQKPEPPKGGNFLSPFGS